MVLPAYQKRGIGRELINWGLANIKHDSIPIYLDSSLSGWNFYEKTGWKVVDVIPVGDAAAQHCGAGYISSRMDGQLPGNRDCKD